MSRGGGVIIINMVIMVTVMQSYNKKNPMTFLSLITPVNKSFYSILCSSYVLSY